MAEIKYRDTYVLIDLFGDVTPYANEAIFLDIEGDAYIKDEEGQELYIGEIDCFVEDVLSIDDLLYTLRKDNVCPVLIVSVLVAAGNVFQLPSPSTQYSHALTDN